jgi:DNA-binding transcriptional LysR family regulator
VQFRKRFPAIEVTLDVASSRTVQQRLVDRTIDIGFTEMPIEEDSLEAKRFMSDQLVAIVPPRHRLLRARRVTAEMFCREPFVVRATGSETRSFVERALTERGLSIQPVMSLGSTEAIKRAVAAGIGVAIVSRLSIGLELKARTPRTVPMVGLNLTRPLFQAWQKESARSSAMEAFLTLVEASVKEG